MNLFDDSYLQVLMITAFIVTIVISAVTVVFEKYFELENRRKVLTFVVSVIFSVLMADLRILEALEWQKFLTNLILTVAFAILFYSYLGAKYITILFCKIKKMLPG